MKSKEYIFKYLRLINILKIKKPISHKELAKKLGMDMRDPRIREITIILKENELCEEIKWLGNVKLLNINLTKLEEYIRNNSEEFKTWGKFIEVTTPGYNY